MKMDREQDDQRQRREEEEQIWWLMEDEDEPWIRKVTEDERPATPDRR